MAFAPDREGSESTGHGGYAASMSAMLERRTRRGARWMRLIGCLVALGLAATVPLKADEDRTEFDPLNFAYVTYVASGIYSSDGRTVFVVRIPISYKVRKDNAPNFGLRLTTKITLGWYDFKPGDIIAEGFPDQVGTFSFVPGAEFRIPMRDNWMLSPFLDGGFGRDSEANEWVGVIGTGVRSRAEWPWKNRRRILWNELLYAANVGGNATAGDFTRLVTKFEVRQPSGKSLWGKPTDFGIFIKNELFPKALKIDVDSETTKEIDNRNEIGFNFGTAEKSKVWLIGVPRVGLAYRFGNGVDQIRLLFSFAY